MVPYDVLHAQKANENEEGGMILLCGDNANEIKVIGSSEPVNIVGHTVNSILVAPQNEKGVIAVQVFGYNAYGKSTVNAAFFLETSNKDGKTWVELKKQWVPLDGKMPRILNYNLEIDINDICYTTDKYAVDKTGFRYVDGNTICKYLIGSLSFEELNAKASELKDAEDKAKKITALEEELEDANERLKIAGFDSTAREQQINHLSAIAKKYLQAIDTQELPVEIQKNIQKEREELNFLLQE